MTHIHNILKNVEFWFDIISKSTFEKEIISRANYRQKIIYHRSLETCAGKLRIIIETTPNSEDHYGYFFGTIVTLRVSKHFKISAKFRRVTDKFNDKSVTLNLNDKNTLELNAQPLWNGFELKRYSNREQADDALALIILQASK
jgi:hypothetical protein